MLDVFMHEAVHALTTTALYIDKELRSDIEKLINQLKNSLVWQEIWAFYSTKDTPYAFKNADEFVAEFFTNFDFQKALYEMPPIENTEDFKTLFDQVISWIIDVLHRLFTDTYKTHFESPNLYSQLHSTMYKLIFRGSDSYNSFFPQNIIAYKQHNNALESIRPTTSQTIDFNIKNINTSLVDVEFHNKPWKDDPTKSNRTIRIYLKDEHQKGYFELVKDHENEYFSVHFKTSKKGSRYNSKTAEYTTSGERKILF